MSHTIASIFILMTYKYMFDAFCVDKTMYENNSTYKRDNAGLSRIQK